MLSNKEVQANRRKSQRMLGAYISKEKADEFTQKLKQNGTNFTDWLIINIEKYMKKN